jgi:glutamate synthase domain-containing protein 3
MAQLGYRTFNEMVGQTQMLDQSTLVAHWKAKGLDFSKLFVRQKELPGQKIYHAENQNHHLEAVLDRRLIEKARAAIDRGAPVKIEEEINNTDRSAGAMLSGAIAKIYGNAGLPHDTSQVSLKGTAGQAFGAWLARGVTFELEGEGNDYVGKGLSGGKIIIYPSPAATFKASENMIIGNVALYGATAGEVYIAGMAGERFAVRNSGVKAVVEAIGDNGCEYMTGGRIVVLGPAGRNFGAGMSGGIGYVLDESGDFAVRVNTAMVGLEKLESPAEVAEVRAMIERHYDYTKSARAKQVLENWKQLLPKFVKVLPKDYKRMLACIEKAEAQGLTGDEAIMAAFEENAHDLSRVGGN